MDIKNKCLKLIVALSMALTLTSCAPSYSAYWTTHNRPGRTAGYYYGNYTYYGRSGIYIGVGVGGGRRYHRRYYRRSGHGYRRNYPQPYYRGSHMRAVHRRRVAPGARGSGPRGGGHRR